MRKKQRDGLKKKKRFWQVIRALFDRARWGSIPAVCAGQKKLFLRRSCSPLPNRENDGPMRSFRPLGALGASQIVSFASETVCAYERHTLFRHVLTAAAGWRVRRSGARRARGARASSEVAATGRRLRSPSAPRASALEAAALARLLGPRARACGGARSARRLPSADLPRARRRRFFRGRSTARSSPLSRRLGRRARRSSPSASRHVFRLRDELPRDAPGGGRLRAEFLAAAERAPAHDSRAPGGAQGARDPLPMRGAAARGGARRLPRRGEGEPHRGERRGPSERRRPDPLRLRGRRHPLQRAPPRLGRRRRRAPRALGRAGRRPRGGGERGGGRRGRAIRRRVRRRRNRPKAPRGRPPGPPRAPRGSSSRRRQESRGRGRGRQARRPRAGARVQQLRVHVARHAAHAPRPRRRPVALQRVRPLVRAERHHAPRGGWARAP